jgi:4-hydroxybenzoyl-CoA thioesterase
MPGKTFSISQVVTWSMADLAATMNSPRAFDCALDTIEAFFREILGLSFRQLVHDHGTGAPVVHASCDYLEPLWEGDEFTLTLAIERLGKSSVTWRVAARRSDGADVFRVRLINVTIDAETRELKPIPKEFRGLLEDYLASEGP